MDDVEVICLVCAGVMDYIEEYDWYECPECGYVDVEGLALATSKKNETI